VAWLPSVIAFFPCSSAFSLPAAPLWPGTHLRVTRRLRLLLVRCPIYLWKASKMWCPGLGLVSCVESNAARLSTKNVAVREPSCFSREAGVRGRSTRKAEKGPDYALDQP
jgi:hypothetical protein